MINKLSLKTLILKRSLKVIAFVSICYIVVILIALFLQHRQLKKISVLDFPEMIELKEIAKTDTSNVALKEKIRNLDLAARRNWFAGLEQLQIGSYLLFSGIIVLLVSLAFIRFLEGPKIPSLTKVSENEIIPKHEIIALSSFSCLLVLIILFFLIQPFAEKTKTSKKIQQDSLKTITQQDIFDNWTHFRGSNGCGIALNEKPVIDWDTATNSQILWKKEVPLSGFSSPILWKDLLFITGGSKYTQALFAYNSKTGELLWQSDTKNITGSPEVAPKVTSDTGYAASTPATNGEFVCAIFATGDLICTNLDGKRIWAKNIRIPDNHYGHSSSLLLQDNFLIVQLDDHAAQMLYCFDVVTGRIIWQKKRETTISWASPIYVNTTDFSAVIVIDSRYVQAYDIKTGEQLWSTECLDGEVASSPVYDSGKIFLANEMASAIALDFKTGKIIWRNKECYLPSVSSPLVLENMVFLFSNAITCLNADTGQIIWEKDVPVEFYSSPLFLKNRIVIFDVQGTMYIIKPDKEKLIVEKQIKLNEGVVATPSIMKKHMWVRGLKYLYSMGVGEN